MRAAVMRAIGEPLRIEEIQVDAPGPHEVLVRVAATGVCHSDLHVLEGSLPNPLPTVLGHEPAGVVEAVGSQVRHVAAGDHVIGCLSAFCGTCEYCVAGRPNLCEGAATMRAAGAPPRLSKDGERIEQFVHLSAFAERMLVHENALVRIRRDVPLDRVALIGCGVTTGLGAVFNRARVPAGRTAVVIGCGGIGLSVVQGCRIAGAARGGDATRAPRDARSPLGDAAAQLRGEPPPLFGDGPVSLPAPPRLLRREGEGGARRHGSA
jgi:S-(hydroxymethyl)glutathione dehydrogenase / alcohol dehydrogenase